MSAPLIVSSWMDRDYAHIKLAMEQVYYVNIISGRLEIGLTLQNAEILRDALTLMLTKRPAT